MKSRWYARQAALGAILLTFVSCGADSCSCDGFVPGEFPPEKVDKTIPTSGEVRVTSSGLQFLGDNLPTILGSFLPGGLNFCVPPTSVSGVDVCQSSTCMDGSQGCDMTMTIDDASITPTPPNQLMVQITIGDLDEELEVRTLGSDCLIKLQSPNDPNLPATFDATLPVTFTVDPSSPFRDVRVDIGDMEMDTSGIDFDIDGKDFWDVFVCEGIDFIAGLNLVRDLLYDQLQSMFGPVIVDQVDAALCVSCENAACPDGTTCDGDNLCRYPDETCPQNPLGISGQLQLGAVLADYVEEKDAAIDLTVRAADHAVADTGLTLGLRSGYDPVAQSVCAPIDPTVRNFAATPISPSVSGNTRPNGQPYHFGLGYHEKALESMLWSVWASGGTCFRIGTESVDLLSTGAFGALLPSVKALTYNRTSEAYVKIVPQTPPNVILGSNTITETNGSYTIDDPLMMIDWKDFDVHIYGYAQDRFTRLLTIRLDLMLPIGVVADGMGGIIPVLGDFEDALQNQRVMNAELIEEDPQRILDLLPTLIGFALPALAGSLSQPIQLPEFFGFRVDIGPGDITSVDNNTSIAIFADLEIVTMPFVAGLETAILGHSVDLSRTTASGLVRPSVTLDVLPLGPNTFGEDLDAEFSYRVDGGTWSLPVKSNQLVIDNPVLVMPGTHTIDVRAQRIGAPYTVDRTPASVEVIIDWESPSLTLSRSGTVMTATAEDLVDHPDDLEYRWRIATGEAGAPWSTWGPGSTLNLADRDLPYRFRVQVESRDRTGNVSYDDQTVTFKQPIERDDAPAPLSSAPNDTTPQAGCNSAGSGAPVGGALLLLVGLGFLVGTRRRRSQFGPVAVALLVTVSGCKCNDDPPSGQIGCDPACAPGDTCINSVCVGSVQCSTDDDCADGEECRGGECVPAPSCESLCDCKPGEISVCENGNRCECVPACEEGCSDDEFCCFTENACTTLPDPCADEVCEPGFGPVVQTDASGNSETCDIDSGECACEELPPLPIGFHGHYAAIDRRGGLTAIATYNSTYGDLMIGTVAANLDVTWYFVDGVPADGDIEGNLNGPRGGIADKGENVGRFTSLAIDDAGRLHVFYRDHDRKVLKYARGTETGGAWNFELHDVDTDGDTGYWTSAVFLDGTVHVVWQTKTAGSVGNWETKLRYMAMNPAAAFSPAAQDLASGPARHPCGFDCEVRGEECIASLGQCVEPTDDCAEACASGTECWQGVCEPTSDEPPAGFIPGIGTNAELSATPAGGLLLVYWDALQDSIVYTQWDGSWGMPTLLGAGTGPWASGVVDASGEVHLAWMDSTVTPPVLMYQNVTSGMPEVIVDGIRDTASGWLVTDVGDDVNLRIAANGDLTAVYQDATLHTLRIATKSGAGMWQVGDLAVPGTPYSGGHGFYAAMLKLPDTQFVVELTVNNQLDPPEAAPTFHP